MSTWVTDLGHLPPVDHPGVPAAAQRRTAFVRQLVEAATSRRIKGSWCSAVRCIARTGRTKCGARIHVARDGGRIQWSCPACGEGGLVTGFEGSEVDFSEYALGRKKAHMWGFGDESLDVLRAETTRSPGAEPMPPASSKSGWRPSRTHPVASAMADPTRRRIL